jgi:hypothetical protein
MQEDSLGLDPDKVRDMLRSSLAGFIIPKDPN